MSETLSTFRKNVIDVQKNEYQHEYDWDTTSSLTWAENSASIPP